jgi:hypothetical protein
VIDGVSSMRVLVVYESMYGQTGAVAERIALGLTRTHPTLLLTVPRATTAEVDGADVLVVGAPTHHHGLSTSESRLVAAAYAEAGAIPQQMRVDPLAPGIREWLTALAPPPGCRAVAFDTRVDGPTILTGRAVHEIDKGLARAGALIVAAPESFLVRMDSSLVDGEGDRAEAWGLTLGAALTALEV